jgi:hypothetical protein
VAYVPSFPYFSFPSLAYPTLPSLVLSESERQLIARHQAESLRCRAEMEIAEAYYLGEQIIDNLRIAVPVELEFLRTIVGWAALAVDPYVERHAIDCFRLADGTDADPYLTSLWSQNGLDAELPLAITDALSMGRGWWVVGSPLESGGVPQVTVESPLNLSAIWNMRGDEPKSLFHEYWADGRRHAALLVPNETISLATNDKGEWEIVGRDQHDFGFVPAVRMPNQPRTNDRGGRSAITSALRSTIDGACRTLLGLEVAREIYSVPQRIILGAAEADFQKSDGTPKSAWETYITSVLGLERDETGQLPDVKQLAAYDPATFTKLIENAASRTASIVLAPPQEVGLYTQGNPVSAEAQNTSESRRNRRARSQQAGFGVPLVKVMQYAAMFDNHGVLPEKFKAIEADWVEVEEINFVGVSDAISKLVSAQIIPATSDVTLKRAGFSAVQRARLAQDRSADDSRQLGRAIANALNPPPAAPGAPASGGPAGL